MLMLLSYSIFLLLRLHEKKKQIHVFYSLSCSLYLSTPIFSLSVPSSSTRDCMCELDSIM